jgi:hypothetical protein
LVCARFCKRVDYSYMALLTVDIAVRVIRPLKSGAEGSTPVPPGIPTFAVR